MKKPKDIFEVSEFNDAAVEILERFLDCMIDNPEFTRKPNEDDYAEYGHENIGWMYTRRGMELYERMCKRLTNVGLKYFDAKDIDLSTGYMIEP